MGFVGRTRELAALGQELDWVRRGAAGADRGRVVLLRGRRRVGKSRLATEFISRSGLPSVHFQAARYAPPEREYRLLASAIAESTLPDADIARDVSPTSLTTALTLLASALPDEPAIVVIDELPWLLESVQGGAGELQRVWDRRLAGKPVLLLLLGSDLGLMQNLTASDQPFYGRSVEMVLEPLHPREVARMTQLDPMSAFDAYLITGGLPLVAQEWPPGMSPPAFLEQSFASSTSALVVAGTRVLDSEFPEGTLARHVLTAIGGRGERTFSGIQRGARSRALNAASLTHSLGVLSAKGVVTAECPLSTKAAPKDRRWRIADPALRFWLAYVEPALAEIDRGRGDLAASRVARGFAGWRGRAVEPVVRSGLKRLPPDPRWPLLGAVGGWWPRSNTPEVDLVGGDRSPVAREVLFVGTVKWRSDEPVGGRDLQTLRESATVVPGVHQSTPLVAVCPAGADVQGLARVWTAEELLEAWD